MASHSTLLQFLGERKVMNDKEILKMVDGDLALLENVVKLFDNGKVKENIIAYIKGWKKKPMNQK